jgi:NADH:ubiquinone oxidoreductase subunit 6 (subunit J)
VLSVSVVLFANPIYSLLALIMVFFSMALLFLSIKIEFLAMIFLIIYIGAISILFLFVIMMFNLKDLQKVEKPLTFYYSAYFFISLLLTKFYFIVTHEITNLVLNFSNLSVLDLDSKMDIITTLRNKQDIFLISDTLYTSQSLIFILLGYVLLSAMVGAIILALTKGVTKK